MRTPTLRYIAALALAAAVLAASCEEGPVGIFASIAGETDIGEGTEAFRRASPSWVSRLGNDYYAGVGSLYRENASGVWQTVTSAAATANGGKTTFAPSGVVAGGVLYAALVDGATGDGLGIWSTADGTTWVRVDAAFPAAGRTLRRLLSANGVLFALTDDETSATSVSLHWLNGAAFASSGVSAADIGMPNSVAWDGTTYWFDAGASILTGTTPGGIAATAPPATDSFSGVMTLAAGTVLFTARSGKLYRYFDVPDPDPDWHVSSVYQNSSSKIEYSFSVPTLVTFGATTALVIGTAGIPADDGTSPALGGYLEFDATGGFDPGTSPAANTTHTQIADAVNFETSLTGQSVRALPLFDEGSGVLTVFALTDGYGLWSNHYSGSAWGKWQRE